MTQPNHRALQGNRPSLVFTNCSVFRAIAVDAYEKMCCAHTEGRRPRGNGGGYVISYDPLKKSFKAACEVIVFAGVWFEAATHVAYVRRSGLAGVKRFDGKFYEKKLAMLGCTHQGILAKAKRLRESRNELMHEKAHLNSRKLIFAQNEAENAYALLNAISDMSGNFTLLNLSPER